MVLAGSLIAIASLYLASMYMLFTQREQIRRLEEKVCGLLERENAARVGRRELDQKKFVDQLSAQVKVEQVHSELHELARQLGFTRLKERTEPARWVGRATSYAIGGGIVTPDPDMGAHPRFG